MIKITPDQKHPKSFWICTLSRLLERSSFYGFRSILALFLVHTLNMSERDASVTYGFFLAAIAISPLLGGVLGDLVLGAKRAMMIGGILQAVGIFIFCVSTKTAMYTGLTFIVIGNGLFSVNQLSSIGKLYLNKLELMDAGYTIFYSAVLIGAALGQGLIPFISDSSFTNGFIACGILMILSIFSLIPFHSDPAVEQLHTPTRPLNKRIRTIFLVLVTLGIFWMMYNFGSNGQLTDDSLFSGSASALYSVFGFVFPMVTGIAASIVWSFYYEDWLIKWSWGFILGAIAFSLPIFSFYSSPFFLVSLFILGLSEILITPMLYSTLTKNSNPKYLGIITALSFIPGTLFNTISNFMIGYSRISPMQSAILATTAFLFIGILMLVVLFIKNRKTKTI